MTVPSAHETPENVERRDKLGVTGRQTREEQPARLGRPAWIAGGPTAGWGSITPRAIPGRRRGLLPATAPVP
jgi:hypothetical protein